MTKCSASGLIALITLFAQGALAIDSEPQRSMPYDSFVGQQTAGLMDYSHAGYMANERTAIVDVIDIRYWQPKSDGSARGPRGGISTAPRGQGWRGVTGGRQSLEVAISHYQGRFPEKAVICSAAGFPLE